MNYNCLKKLNIIELNTYSTNWYVFAMVVYKNDLVEYKHELHGKGVRLNFTIRDSSDIIDCVAFRETANTLNRLLKVNNCYYIRNCSIKSSMNKPREIYLNTISRVKLIKNNNTINRIKNSLQEEKFFYPHELIHMTKGSFTSKS